MAIIGDDELFGGIDEDEIVQYVDDPETEIEITQFSGLFGLEYTDVQELERDIEETHSATIHRDAASAIRRRKIGGFFHRKAWKCLKFKTPKEFAKVRLGLGLASYHRIARIAEIELLIAKNSIKVEFLELNVRDSYLIMLDEYPSVSHVQLVATMAERKIPFQGKRIAEIAEELFIPRKKAIVSRGYSHVDADAGSCDEAEQLALGFTNEEKRSAWEATTDYNSLMRKNVSIGYLSAIAIPFYVNSLKKG